MPESEYRLKTPCSNCPFRTDVDAYLNPERVRALERSMVHIQESFPCHKTTVSDGDGNRIADSSSQQCAGAMILLEKIERPNQLMRIAQRFGIYDPSELHMDAPVFDSFEDMANAQLLRETSP